jgi:hypothetical protein
LLCSITPSAFSIPSCPCVTPGFIQVAPSSPRLIVVVVRLRVLRPMACEMATRCRHPIHHTDAARSAPVPPSPTRSPSSHSSLVHAGLSEPRLTVLTPRRCRPWRHKPHLTVLAPRWCRPWTHFLASRVINLYPVVIVPVVTSCEAASSLSLPLLSIITPASRNSVLSPALQLQIVSVSPVC